MLGMRGRLSLNPRKTLRGNVSRVRNRALDVTSAFFLIAFFSTSLKTNAIVRIRTEKERKGGEMGQRKQIYYISTIKIMVMDIIEWNINNGVSSKESNVQYHEQLVMKVYHKPFFYFSTRHLRATKYFDDYLREYFGYS